MKIRNVVINLLIVVSVIGFLGTAPVLADCDGDGYHGPNVDKDRGDMDKDRDPDRIPVGWYVPRTNPWR